MTHVVVGIVIKKSNPLSYLLVSSKKEIGEYTGYYYPPAGHLEDGENEIDALKRELQEELGINVVNSKKIDTDESDIKNQKTSWYICDVDSYEFTINHDELNDVGFFTRTEMESMKIWPATKKVFGEHVFSKLLDFKK